MMLNKLFFQYGFFLIVICISCNSSSDPVSKEVIKDTVDSFDSALPHGATLPDKELSDQDKLKLAKASGKEAILISLDSFIQIMQNDQSGWCLYHFWNLDCEKCLEMNDYLLTMNATTASKITTKFINTLSLYPDQVNAYIREKGILQEVFSIPTDTLNNWSYTIDPTWDGTLPALLLMNNNDGTQLFYQQGFSKEELQAILETLTF